MRLGLPAPALSGQLTALCVRSKAHWGYSSDMLEAWESDLTVTPDAIEYGNVMAAFSGNIAIGVVEILMEENEAWLEKLFVDPQSLGVGAGRALFHWAAERSRELGAVRLIIDSEPKAEDFYRKMGAIRIGERASTSIPGRILPQLAFDLA